MKKLILFLATLFFSSNFAFSQFQIDWQQSFGGMNDEKAYDIIQTEGGYLLAGNTLSNDGQVNCNEDGGALWLVKIDNSGNLLWQNCYEGSDTYRMLNVIGSPDYYLVGGTISDPYPDTYNLWVAKIDSASNIIWDRVLGNTIGVLGGDQYGEATSDGGIVVTAQIDSQGGDITTWYGGYDGWVVKLDSNGITEWDFTIGSSTSFEFINCIIQTNDGGYLAGLYGSPQGTGTGNVDCFTQSIFKSDAILFKLDVNGNPEWHQCYGGNGNDAVNTMLEVEDGYIIAAIGGSNDGDLASSGWHGGNDVWLVKTDFLGNIIWQKCYGGSDSDAPKKIFQTTDGGFVVFANTHSFDGDVVGNPSNSSAHPSIWVFKTDNMGELLWQQCIGGHAKERVYGVVKQSDYKYVVAGEMNFSPSGDVNCSNFVYGSGSNYWAFGLTDTTANVIENAHNTTGVKVYPNPTQLFITFELPNQYKKSMLEIIDVYGNVLIKTELNNHKEEISVQVLKSGIYFYTLRAKGLNKAGKIVIRK